MQNRHPAEPDPEVLPESVAGRLLARASELDVAGAAGSAVTDLRAAAAEAGISARAFDAALAELHADGKASVPDVRERPRRRSRMRALTALVAALIAAGALVVFRQQGPAGEAAVRGAAIVEEGILLRCLSPGEAAELIRPLLGGSNSVVYSAAQAPRVLTIRATPEQLQNVKSVLDKYEGAASSACAPRPTGTVTP